MVVISRVSVFVELLEPLPGTDPAFSHSDSRADFRSISKAVVFVSVAVVQFSVTPFFVVWSVRLTNSTGRGPRHYMPEPEHVPSIITLSAQISAPVCTSMIVPD